MTLLNKNLYIELMISLIIISSNATPFSPIQAGTFYITADDLKGTNKKTIKQIDLQTPWSVFNQNLNINVVCVISSINMDQRVGMQFTYKLADKQNSQNKKKIILVQIFDKKGFQFPQLKMGINYLIAQNIRTDFYNMTDFQQHLPGQSVTQQQSNPANKQVHNQIFLFPNGFSSFNITHHIMYSYIPPNYDMYTIHYMTHMDGDHDKQGWLMGRDFILYRYIMYPKYQFGYKTCGAVYQTQLMDDFYFQCDKKGIDGWFFGVMGYSGKNFAGHFQTTRNGFNFNVQKSDNGSMYNILAIPYRVNQKFNFIDNRIHPYNYISQKSFFGYLVAAVVLLIIIIVAIAIMKKKKIIYFDLQQQKVNQMTSSSSNYNPNNKQRSSPKKNPKSKVSSDAPQKTSDEQMKQKQFCHSQEFDTEEGKTDSFTIQ